MPIGDIILNIVFYIFAGVVVFCSLMVAMSKNIIHSVFALLGVLFSTAAFYAIMGVDFMVAMQILIYVGGILLLIIFAVMLTRGISNINVSNVSSPTIISIFLVFCLFSLMLIITMFHKWAFFMKTTEAITAKIGELLANEYLLPFEILSLVLLAALIGATFLSRKEAK